MSAAFHACSDLPACPCPELSSKHSGTNQALDFEATLTLIRLIKDEGSDSDRIISQDLQGRSHDDVVEFSLPPPEPYYNRSALLRFNDGLYRTRSCNINRSAKDFLQSERINKSIPNTHCHRSHHNRSIGRTVDFKSISRDREMLRLRVAEFDEMLNEL